MMDARGRRRCLVTVAAALTLATAGLRAGRAQEPEAPALCRELAIPAELDLACRADPAEPRAVLVTPSRGEFAALSRMRVEELVREGTDARAWSEPDAWLRGRLSLDTSGLAEALAGLASDPDSPLSGRAATRAAEAVEGLLDTLGRLPLSACGDARERRPGLWEIRCRYTLGGLGILRLERLQASGDRRIGLALHAANEQRLRHFEAIANTLQP